MINPEIFGLVGLFYIFYYADIRLLLDKLISKY